MDEMRGPVFPLIPLCRSVIGQARGTSTLGIPESHGVTSVSTNVVFHSDGLLRDWVEIFTSFFKPSSKLIVDRGTMATR